MGKYLLRLVVLSTPLLLGACGEGWEMQRTDSVFPYGNERTAGSGVAYVRAKMMPEKELNIKPVMEEVKVEPAPVLDAEEIFVEAQTKGGAPVKKEVDTIVAPKKDAVDDEHSSNAMQDGNSKVIKSSGLVIPELRAAEEYIAQAPKQIDPPHARKVEDVEPSYGSEAALNVDVLSGDETLEVYENKVAQPIKKIVVPKRDFLDFRSKGQKDLDDIYKDPLGN